MHRIHLCHADTLDDPVCVCVRERQHVCCVCGCVCVFVCRYVCVRAYALLYLIVYYYLHICTESTFLMQTQLDDSVCACVCERTCSVYMYCVCVCVCVCLHVCWNVRVPVYACVYFVCTCACIHAKKSPFSRRLNSILGGYD